jgi:mannose-1-phosphate guanylyltransferase
VVHTFDLPRRSNVDPADDPIGAEINGTEPGARIVGPAWIGHGSHIRAGATVTRCALFDYTRIGQNMVFAEMIVSPDYCVNNRGETVYRGDDNCPLRWSDARA